MHRCQGTCCMCFGDKEKLVSKTGGSRVTLSRYRMALIGLLAVATALEMWGANVALNLAGQHLHHAMHSNLLPSVNRGGGIVEYMHATACR